jgi:hypothetical protein
MAEGPFLDLPFALDLMRIKNQGDIMPIVHGADLKLPLEVTATLTADAVELD